MDAEIKQTGEGDKRCDVSVQSKRDRERRNGEERDRQTKITD